jgi:glycosyltransferase involved in cell wall biosynthesis
MKISIITVTFNNKAGLLRAIESVRSQTYKNVEHIIVDGR